MAKNIFLFSGQGSQYVGMAKEFYDKYDGAKAVFDTAEKVLGYDLKKIVFDGPDTELNKTVYSQPAIMACSLCAYEAAKAEGITFDGVAGHSLGEYAAMAVSGVVSVEDAFRLIKVRAAAMQEAAEKSSGSMYAIIGLPAEEVEKVCEETEGYVVPVNYNSTVQTVIAGETEACEKAAEKFTAMKKRAIKLNVASAFHSKMMLPAADTLEKFAVDIKFNEPKVAFYSNLYGKKLDDFSDMAHVIAKHVVSPVRFTDELAEMEKDGFENYIELGPNKVLTGLVKKTLKGRNAVNIENNATMEKALEVLKG